MSRVSIEPTHATVRLVISGTEHMLSAEDITELRDALNKLEKKAPSWRWTTSALDSFEVVHRSNQGPGWWRAKFTDKPDAEAYAIQLNAEEGLS